MKTAYAQTQQAALIAQTLGVRRAADYLCKRGWSIEAVLWLLLGPRAVERFVDKERGAR